MRHNLSSSHRQSRTSIKHYSFSSLLNSDLYIFIFIHLFPIGIDDNIRWLWANINRNRSFSIKNSSIRTPNCQMNKINSWLIKSITYYWSIPNRLIYTVNISIIPEIVSRGNRFIWRITTSPRIKGNSQRSRSRLGIRCCSSFHCISTLNRSIYIIERILTIFQKTAIVLSSDIALHISRRLDTLLIYHLKIIILREIRENPIHNRVKFTIGRSSSKSTYFIICININKQLLKPIPVLLNLIISKILCWNPRTSRIRSPSNP